MMKNENVTASFDEILKYERDEAREWAIFLYKSLIIWAPGDVDPFLGGRKPPEWLEIE